MCEPNKLHVMSDVTCALVTQLVDRDKKGQEKYGTSLDRTDLSIADWLQHQTEELLDGAGYAQAALREIKKQEEELIKLRKAAQEYSLFRKAIIDAMNQSNVSRYRGEEFSNGVKHVLINLDEAIWRYDLQATLRQLGK